MTLRDAVLKELLEFYQTRGPDNYLRSDRLKARGSDAQQYEVTLNQLLAEGLIVGLPDQESNVAVAINPARHSEVAALLAEPTPAADGGLAGKILLLILVMSLGLLGLWLMDGMVRQILWFFFCLVCYPLILAFTHVSAKLRPDELIQLYQLGVQQIPFIGDFLSSLIHGGTRGKAPRKR